MTEGITNTCTLIAMRELLGDPAWGPAEIVYLIEKHDGLIWSPKCTLDLFSTIEQYAPVKVWRDYTFTEGHHVVRDGISYQELEPGEQVTIGFEVPGGIGHMECTQVESIKECIHAFLLRYTAHTHELMPKVMPQPYVVISRTRKG